jgi:hypothetical protein
MQTVRDYADRRGGEVIRIALAILIAIALAAPSNAQTVADTPPKKPIQLDKKSAVSKKDAGLASALAVEPVMERGLRVESPPRVVEYFTSRPAFASRLMAEYGDISGALEREEDADSWTFTGISGARYVFTAKAVGKNVRFVRFSYFHSSPFGIGLKISGVGAVVMSVSPGKTRETAAVDYDIYFAEGREPLDKIAVSVSIHMAEIKSDFAALAEGFATLCEAAYDDPESVADEMRDADDVFTKKEIDGFESAMGVKRRGKAR